MKKLFINADRRWEETRGYSPLRVASRIVGRRSQAPTLTGEDGEVLPSSVEISPETIESNNSHTRSSGDIESQETYNSHTGSRGWARDHHALNQFFAENSIATEIDGENPYDTENSISDINQNISNMSNLRSYHGEEAIRLFQTPYPSAAAAAIAAGAQTALAPGSNDYPPPYSRYGTGQNLDRLTPARVASEIQPRRIGPDMAVGSDASTYLDLAGQISRPASGQTNNFPPTSTLHSFYGALLPRNSLSYPAVQCS